MRINSTLARMGLAITASCIAAPAFADWQPVPSSRVNSQGYVVTGYWAKPSGSGCVGGQKFAKGDDKGTSARQWTTATKADGGIVCSGGTWFKGNGGFGGAESDVLIKGGRAYKNQ